MTGVALSFLMSYSFGEHIRRLRRTGGTSDLLKSLVVDKAGGVFGNVELAFLDLLAELPAITNISFAACLISV